jgi:hypothetical protein
MWCRACQQDVPGVRSPYDASLRCTRCNGPLLSPADSGETRAGTYTAHDGAIHEETALDDGSQEASSPALPCWDDWALEEDLKSAEHLIGEPGILAASDDAELEPGPTPEDSDEPPRSSPETRVLRRHVDNSVDQTLVRLSRYLLAGSLFTLALAGGLLVLSLTAPRPELWRLGMPLLLVGQVGLILGLVIQLDSVWRSNRAANDTLEEMDQEVAHLRRTTAVLATRDPSSRSFYLHMAHGVSPHLLLADLRGQLEMLDARLSEGDRGGEDV